MRGKRGTRTRLLDGINSILFLSWLNQNQDRGTVFRKGYKFPITSLRMSQFSDVADGDIMWVCADPEAAEKQMKENNGCFSGMLKPVIKNPEVMKLIVIPESEGAVSIWKDILDKIKKEKIDVRSDIFQRTKKWKKKEMKYFAAVYNEKSGDAPVMALCSQKSEKSGLWIDLITTNSPLMPRPYTTMLQNALREFATSKLGVELFVPKEYQISEDKPILVENEKPIELDESALAQLSSI